MTDEELYYKLEPNGCWHKFPHSIKELDAVKITGTMSCLKCKQVFSVSQIVASPNPDFNTPEGFDWLWNHIQGTEICRTFPKWYNKHVYDRTDIIQSTVINYSLFKGALKKYIESCHIQQSK